MLVLHLMCCQHYACEFHLQNGRTALAYLSMRGDADCVRLLLNAGSENDARDKVRIACVFCCCIFLVFVGFSPTFDLRLCLSMSILLMPCFGCSFSRFVARARRFPFKICVYLNLRVLHHANV
jgi:hypothetical protein